ncbi:AGE family epimerase/isomerase [Halopelagius longus]|uniref:AGE family epimerase/isomerase n=1 Tax=Halopelagius longus TaxID=1236180 RepID=A0A1H1G1T8_9EURY|nr:AGE family epimerase/isomerase [Halopelagius longus]RDI69900.1 AGE family epimerase/isomerase [Halopelagius longus]SDR07029.1 Mannose or cellobiose epimerase, N-acyl-D-glucosamine 2-epimerase family [Halopelagius longus]
MTDTPYRTPAWLRRDALGVLDFHRERSLDTHFGGYTAQVSDIDGAVYDQRTKHLVPTARFVFGFSVGKLLDGPVWCEPAAEHGLSYLRNVAYDEEHDGYGWQFEGRDVVDDTRATYGHAFVLLAYATAARAGIGNVEHLVTETADLLDDRFFEPEHGAYASNRTAEWDPVEPSYRGQNANMHACEALLAAYEAVGDDRCLDRATTVAEKIALDRADAADGLLWEHFTEDWAVDWEYNRDQKADLFRPWGYQPGHLLEWSKLLVQLDEHDDADWYIDRAERFFEAAVEDGWDDERGGFYYTFDRDGSPIVEDKYTWALEEGLGAAARLGAATGDDDYWEWFDTIHAYLDEYATNHSLGIRYERLTPDGDVHPTIDETPKVKSGYHHVNSCYEALRALDAV